MRAWDWLLELSESHDVHLIVVGTSGDEDPLYTEESPAVSVASAHATRGLPLTPNNHYLQCRNAREAARQIKRLLTEPGLGPRLTMAARRSIVEAELVRLP